MKLSLRKALHLMAGASILAVVPISLTADLALSQATRTIKIVVPFPPGGGVDIVARLMADQIGRVQRASVIVENRPGAGTLIATEAVARAAPDGNTVLFLANSFVINAGLRKGAYDPLTSFEPVCLLTRSPNAVVVNSASPYRALSDLIADARAKPGNLTMAFQRAGHQSTRCGREAQTCGGHRDDQCSISWLGARRQRNSGWACECSVCQLPGGGGAGQCGKSTCACDRLASQN